MWLIILSFTNNYYEDPISKNLVCGLDKFLSIIFSQIIENNLPEDILSTLKKKLFSKYCMSIQTSIDNFEIFHNELSLILKSDTITFELYCVQKICKVEKSSNHNYKLHINCKYIDSDLLNYFLNINYIKINQHLFKESLSIPELSKKTKLSIGIISEKIEYLSISGMIFSTNENNPDTKYRCIFNSIIIDFVEGLTSLTGKIDEKYFKQSIIFKILNYEKLPQIFPHTSSSNLKNF